MRLSVRSVEIGVHPCSSRPLRSDESPKASISVGRPSLAARRRTVGIAYRPIDLSRLSPAGRRRQSVIVRSGGNRYLRVLRSQLERYIAAQLGMGYLADKKSKTELHVVRKEIAAHRKKLALLEARKIELERVPSHKSNRAGPSGRRQGLAGIDEDSECSTVVGRHLLRDTPIRCPGTVIAHYDDIRLSHNHQLIRIRKMGRKKRLHSRRLPRHQIGLANHCEILAKHGLHSRSSASRISRESVL